MRKHLSIHLVLLVVTLIALGTWAMLLIANLSIFGDENTRQDTDMAALVHRLSYDLSSMDRGMLLTLMGENSGHQIFNQSQRMFDRTLTRIWKEKHPIADLNRQFTTNYSALQQAAAKIFSTHLRNEQTRLYHQQFEPAMVQVDILLSKFRRLNDQAVLANSRNYQTYGEQMLHDMTIGMVLAILVFCAACYGLARAILKPIKQLANAAREAALGRPARLIPANFPEDEMGILAKSILTMGSQVTSALATVNDNAARVQQSMETTLASFPDPLFVLDPEGRIEFANQAAEELARGLAVQEELSGLLGQSIRNVLDTGENFLPLKYKQAVSFRLNGQAKYFLPRILAVRNKEDVLLGVTLVLSDVTRFLLLDDLKSSLVTTASHELKSHLTSMRMALHLLTEKNVTELTPRRQELLRLAREDAEVLFRILNDLLDLARMEHSENGLYKEKVTAKELVEAAFADLNSKIAVKGLKITCAIAVDLPPLRVDRQRIGLVLNNLIGNAIKHSPEKENIVVRASRLGNHAIQFNILDRGPGIPEEYHEMIFERFFRIPGQTKTGSGLGLSIAREAVLAHGGKIGVKSRPGQGSEFYFSLPLMDKPENPQAELSDAVKSEPLSVGEFSASLP